MIGANEGLEQNLKPTISVPRTKILVNYLSDSKNSKFLKRQRNFFQIFVVLKFNRSKYESYRTQEIKQKQYTTRIY